MKSLAVVPIVGLRRQPPWHLCRIVVILYSPFCRFRVYLAGLQIGRGGLANMAAQLTIPYETLVSLVAQLSPGEQENLLQWLQERRRQQVALSDDAWVAAFRSLVIETPLVGSIPLRRAEWYDDDGR